MSMSSFLDSNNKSRSRHLLPGFVSWPDEFIDRYRQAGYWRGETFGDMLFERATQYSNRIALTCGEKRWSYQELYQRANHLAAGFQRLGIKPMDRVVIQLPNIAEFFAVCFGLFMLGALPVLALPSHRRNEISYFCEFTEAVAYIISDTFRGFDYRVLARQVQDKTPTLKHVIVVGDPDGFISLQELYGSMTELPQINSYNVALFQVSGGSTGLPKLIPRTHNDYIYSLRASSQICGIDESSVYLTVLPVSHNFSLSSPGSLGTLYGGGRVVLAPHPSPEEAFSLIEQEGVTITALVPPAALIWLEAATFSPHNLSSLRVLQVGGAKLNAEVAKRIRPTFGCTLQQVYGMAEGLVNYTRLNDPDDIVIYTQGRPISPDDEIRILDEADHEVEPGQIGHLLTRGPYTIRGYYNSPNYNARAFTHDGFYRTGDLVRVTPEGYLVVEGRAKDQINRGGDKISAEEIENHLLAHPGIKNVAVVAMPDFFLGERSCAFVIPYHHHLKRNELISFLSERGLAGYKIPDRIEFVHEFPKTGVGKINKKMLGEMISQKLEQSETI
jgi:2,3-dihydroxybenzoate-AMP ligase